MTIQNFPERKISRRKLFLVFSTYLYGRVKGESESKNEYVLCVDLFSINLLVRFFFSNVEFFIPNCSNLASGYGLNLQHLLNTDPLQLKTTIMIFESDNIQFF